MTEDPSNVYLENLTAYLFRKGSSRVANFLGEALDFDNPQVLAQGQMIPELIGDGIFEAEVGVDEGFNGTFSLVLPLSVVIQLCGKILTWDNDKIISKIAKMGLDHETQKASHEIFSALTRGFNKILGPYLIRELHVYLKNTRVWSPDQSAKLPEGQRVRIETTLGAHQPVPILMFYPASFARFALEAIGQQMPAGQAPKKFQKPTAGAEEEALNLKGLRVLTVDDVAAVRKYFVTILEKEGAEVYEAENARDAMGLIKRKRIDIMFTDIMMPGVNGYELVKKIREDETKDNESLPIVMCSAKGQTSDIMSALKAGASDYIIKPFKRDLLLKKIAKVCKSEKNAS